MDPSALDDGVTTTFKSLIDGKEVDFGRQSEDYAKHRPGFPDSFVTRIFDAYKHSKGSEATPIDEAKLHIADIGTGTGVVAFQLARIMTNSKVVGVDIAENQIKAANNVLSGLPLETQSRMSFQVAPAESTLLESGAFDLIVCGQCWPWFKHTEAMKEMRRILKPGGLLVIGQYCYLPKQSKVALDTENLILQHNPEWKMVGFNGLYPGQVDQLVVEGGFNLVELFAYDYAQPFTHESWRGRIRTCNGVGSGVLTAEEIVSFDEQLAAYLAAEVEESFTVAHRVWALIVS